jgi:hypothetical protein
MMNPLDETLDEQVERFMRAYRKFGCMAEAGYQVGVADPIRWILEDEERTRIMLHPRPELRGTGEADGHKVELAWRAVTIRIIWAVAATMAAETPIPLNLVGQVNWQEVYKFDSVEVPEDLERTLLYIQFDVTALPPSLAVRFVEHTGIFMDPFGEECARFDREIGARYLGADFTWGEHHVFELGEDYEDAFDEVQLFFHRVGQHLGLW